METDLTPAETAASTESAHTTSRKSAPTLRMDLIPRGERRRRWTTEQKQTIAAQSLAPGASPTEVARLHGISTGQLYTWRHALKAAQPSAAIGRFARVEVMPQPVAPADVAARPPGLIEIAWPDGSPRRRDRSARLAPCAGGVAPMIVLPSGAHVWLACGYTDMRKGMDGLAMLAQQVLAEDPFSGALFAFRGKRGGLVKLLWHDGIGLCVS
jgi:transposase-like protein